MSDLREDCPECGKSWITSIGADGTRYRGMFAGNVSGDRVTSWHCMHCGASWPRGAEILNAGYD